MVKFEDKERAEGWGVIGNWEKYFNDPALDRLAEITIDLATETWTAMDRQKITEWILESKGYLQPNEVDDFQPTQEQEALLTEQRNQFISQIFQGLLRNTTESAE